MINHGKMDLFLKDLNRDLDYLRDNDNIDHIYHNFTTTLSTTINTSLWRCLIKIIK